MTRALPFGAQEQDAEELAPGLMLHRSHLDLASQQALVAELRLVLKAVPLFTPVMPKTGTPFSVRMSNCGPLGWVADRAGYRYQPLHPTTGQPWPPMPQVLLELWHRLAATPLAPEACLINWYQGRARMGLHQDRDEETFDAPVLSLSLGDTCLFRFGGLKRTDPTRSVQLESGDVLVMGGPARLCFHGVDRLMADSSPLLPDGGRLNLTLRRVHR